MKFTKASAIVLLVIIFFFRLFYGLCNQFWADDELQVYLIGLKYFTTQQWPFFGPDIVYTQTQLPGALQGLLVGLPFFLFPFPEAPYILLNLISFAALIFLAWYICKRLPEIDKWIVYGWVLLCPWALNFSAHVTNPSYVLPATVLFFISVFELLPFLTKNILHKKLCFFLLGFSLLWVFQLHMSYVIMLPFIAVAIFFHIGQRKKMLQYLLFLIFGMLISGSTLVPTLLLENKNSATASNIIINSKNLLELPNIVTRFLSFSCYELPRFIGKNTAERLQFLRDYIWLSPFIILSGIAGLLQAGHLILCFFTRRKNALWRPVKFFTLAVILLLYISFLFSIKGPSSHTFYLLFPVSLIYAFHAWDKFLHIRLYKKIASVFLICAIITSAAIAHHNFNTKSLYKNRQKVVKAIEQKNYTILGKRRYE